MEQVSASYNLLKTEVSGFTLEKTVKLMKLSFSRVLLTQPNIDITVDQWVIIQLLYQNHSISQHQLAKLAFKDAPTITKMLDILAFKQIVKREIHGSDKRKNTIELTALGKIKYDQILPLVQQFRHDAYEGLSHEELLGLDKILQKIFNNLSKHH
jgi:DNA-binding MarR family transcriptional regulator